jgi:FlaA1/EpsC-like NDP-sugar epimerase
MAELQNSKPKVELRSGFAYRALSVAAGMGNRVPAFWLSRGTQLALDGALCIFSLYFAYQLRFDGQVPAAHRTVMWSLMLLLPVFRPLLMLSAGAYDSIWRYFNLRDSAVLAISAAPASIALLLIRYLFGQRLWSTVVPASVIIIEFGVFLLLAAALRGFRRVTYEISRPTEARPMRALIVGTEATLPRAVRHVHGSAEIEIAGLLASEQELVGKRIGGFLVMEKPTALARLLVTQRVDLVMIADSRPEWMAETVATANDFGAEVRLLPSAGSLVRGDFNISAKTKPEAAFGHPESDMPAAILESDPAVLESFRDRVVLITGAGGSIGSELAGQALRLPIAMLLLLDRDENSIFELSHSLAPLISAADQPARLVPIVGDIRDSEYMRVLFERYRPHIVLHAAAYKHVPVMEQNISEAVLNNILGTRTVAQMATSFGAERFVMISTDKAVHPSSVMGATKRIAEMVVTEMAQAANEPHNPRTKMACVRFGNVVGSRGSVVPIFLEQIRAGGPVTITDEHMTRYFMTIPEAAQLVLQAASLASEGTVYMLDMGDPIRITALARKLVELSGLRPGKDIEIKFVGARPGEKIVEVLWTPGTEVLPTSFKRVLAVKAEPVPADFNRLIAALEKYALTRNEAALLENLRHMPIGFTQASAAEQSQNSKARSAFVN